MTASVDALNRLTSLLRVEERLTEAEHFARQMCAEPDLTILGYELNAFLSAARSVTFLLQKEFAHVDGFSTWWAEDRTTLGADSAARFFLELRNFSQKQGPISTVGGSDSFGRRYFMFAGTAEPVPVSLLYRDVADCCLEHVAKLARVVLRFAEKFPFHACPARAITPEGMSALGFDVDAVGALLGFPNAFLSMRPEGSIDDYAGVLRRHVDPVDFDEINRIANYKSRPPVGPGCDDFGTRWSRSLVEQIESRTRQQK